MNDFKYYLYLTCLNCKESSDNVGYMNSVTHAYVNNPDPYLNVYACREHMVTPGLWDDTFQHLAIGKTSIFSQAVRTRKLHQASHEEVKEAYFNPKNIDIF